MRKSNADYALDSSPLTQDEFMRVVAKDWGYPSSFTVSREAGQWVARHWITGELITNPWND